MVMTRSSSARFRRFIELSSTSRPALWSMIMSAVSSSSSDPPLPLPPLWATGRACFRLGLERARMDLRNTLEDEEEGCSEGEGTETSTGEGDWVESALPTTKSLSWSLDPLDMGLSGCPGGGGGGGGSTVG